MGFRLHNINPIYRAYITRMSSSRTHKYSHPYPVTQNLISHLRDPPLIISQNPIYNIPIRWHLGHSHHDDDDGHHHHISGEEGEKIFKLGLASDIALSTGKALTGYLSGSTAIIADAAHSVSDVVLSGIALWSFKAAKAPRDEEHPYGHGKFETLGALGISCMLLATAGGIAWHALELLLGLISADPEIINHSLTHEHGHGHNHSGHYQGIDMNHPVLALNMTILSIGIKEGLYWITKRAGEKQGSGLMIANAWHHRADAVSSVVALIGVGGAIMGIKFLDPLAGFVVSIMILKAGLETGYQSIMELVDSAIPSKYLDPVKQTILQVEGVKGSHRLRGRRAGSSLYVDVNIEVDPFSSVSAAHEIGEHVRHQIHKSHPEVAEVFIHIDPAISQVVSSVMDQKETVNYCNAAPSKQEFKEGEATAYQKSCPMEDKDIEDAVSNIISSKFPEIMVVEHITQHLLQGKLILQIEVSMPPNTLVRDAMDIAKKAEQDIFKASPTPNIIHVSIQLRLGQPIPPAKCGGIN